MIHKLKSGDLVSVSSDVSLNVEARALDFVGFFFLSIYFKRSLENLKFELMRQL